MGYLNIKTSIRTGVVYLALVLLIPLNAMANEGQRSDVIDKFQVQNNQVAPDFKTLFLSQEQRKKIDLQREAYLNPPLPKKEEVIEPVVAKAMAPKKKRIYIPPKVAISAVIVKPDGSTLIRVNNKYNKSPSKHIQLDNLGASTNGVPITVNGKTKVVPVGKTLLTRRNKLVDTSKLDAAKRKQAMPKTEQKAVKQRLDQVKLLSTPPVTDLPPVNNP